MRDWENVKVSRIVARRRINHGRTDHTPVVDELLVTSYDHRFHYTHGRNLPIVQHSQQIVIFTTRW